MKQNQIVMFNGSSDSVLEHKFFYTIFIFFKVFNWSIIVFQKIIALIVNIRTKTENRFTADNTI